MPRILLASRLPEHADATARAAARLAKQIGGELLLVYVAEELATIPSLQVTTGESAEALRERMRAEIEAAATAHLAQYHAGTLAGIWLAEGDVTEEIVRIARAEAVDYLVIGTEKRTTLSQIVLGGTTQKILHNAPCPVLVVPPQSEADS